MSGRFAPSPTGDLHLGNLRTALLAWLAGRSSGGGFLIRMEDLDRVTSSVQHEQRQLADLAAIGIDWDPPVLRQSERFDLYRASIDRLRAVGRVYECFCTRREIQAEIAASVSAPHAHLPDGAYPGTCRRLSEADRRRRTREGRRPALRLLADDRSIAVDDVLAGTYVGAVDDVVLARADGVPAYNLAVVVDDAEQGVTQVVRGDDLLSSTPRHVLLQRLLGYPTPEYWHVALVLGPDGQRLAKRHGAVTLAELAAAGVAAGEVRRRLLASLGQVEGAAFDVDRVPPAAIDVDQLLG
jgi:glutamyl-tRNA synthetase